MELPGNPPLVGADAALRAEVANQVAILQTFYHASLDAYAGNREDWSRSIAQVTQADPANP